MSLLADLLSKTKTKESKKDIPPDLRRTVVDWSYKRKARRKIIIFSIFVFIVFLTGFGTIYVMEMLKSSLTTSIAAKTRLSQPPQSPTFPDEKPANFPKAEPPVRIAATVPKVLLPDSYPQKKVPPVMESSLKTPKGPIREAEREFSSVITQAPAKGKPSLIETPSSDKAQQKTDKDVHLFAARTHEAKGEFKQAIDHYLKALELDPTNYVVMNNISGAYLRLRLFNDALNYANKALGIKANYAPCIINAGIAHVSQGNLAEGEVFLAKAVALDPSNRVALFNLAVLCEKQGSYDRAFENYYKLSQMRDVDGCLGAARILERQGRDSESARFYREILTIDTATPSARQFANQKLTQLSR